MSDKNIQKERSPFIEKLMPDATDEEKEIATENFRRYLDTLFKIFKSLPPEKRAALTSRRKGTHGKNK